MTNEMPEPADCREAQGAQTVNDAESSAARDEPAQQEPENRCEECGEIIEYDADPECPHDGQPKCPYCESEQECEHTLADGVLEALEWNVSPFEADGYADLASKDYVSPLPMPLDRSGWSEAQKREALGDLAPLVDQWPSDTEPIYGYEEEAFEVILPHLTVPIVPVRCYSSWCGYDWMVYYSPQRDGARAEIAEIVRRLHEGFSRLAALEPEGDE